VDEFRQRDGLIEAAQMRAGLKHDIGLPAANGRRLGAGETPRHQK
jgi:hypothetical protein